MKSASSTLINVRRVFCCTTCICSSKGVLTHAHIATEYRYNPVLTFWTYFLSSQRLKVKTWIYHQLNAQFYLFNNNITSWSSTCFEHLCTHLQEDNCIFTVSGIVPTVWQHTVGTIPDTVTIQLSSWRRAQRCSKHVEDHDIILLLNK
jgi:hypothetical protein